MDTFTESLKQLGSSKGDTARDDAVALARTACASTDSADEMTQALLAHLRTARPHALKPSWLFVCELLSLGASTFLPLLEPHIALLLAASHNRWPKAHRAFFWELPPLWEKIFAQSTLDHVSAMRLLAVALGDLGKKPGVTTYIVQVADTAKDRAGDVAALLLTRMRAAPPQDQPKLWRVAAALRDTAGGAAAAALVEAVASGALQHSIYRCRKQQHASVAAALRVLAEGWAAASETSSVDVMLPLPVPMGGLEGVPEEVLPGRPQRAGRQSRKRARERHGEQCNKPKVVTSTSASASARTAARQQQLARIREGHARADACRQHELARAKAGYLELEQQLHAERSRCAKLERAIAAAAHTRQRLRDAADFERLCAEGMERNWNDAEAHGRQEKKRRVASEARVASLEHAALRSGERLEDALGRVSELEGRQEEHQGQGEEQKQVCGEQEWRWEQVPCPALKSAILENYGKKGHVNFADVDTARNALHDAAHGRYEVVTANLKLSGAPSAAFSSAVTHHENRRPGKAVSADGRILPCRMAALRERIAAAVQRQNCPLVLLTCGTATFVFIALSVTCRSKPRASVVGGKHVLRNLVASGFLVPGEKTFAIALLPVGHHQRDPGTKNHGMLGQLRHCDIIMRDSHGAKCPHLTSTQDGAASGGVKDLAIWYAKATLGTWLPVAKEVVECWEHRHQSRATHL